MTEFDLTEDEVLDMLIDNTKRLINLTQRCEALECCMRLLYTDIKFMAPKFKSALEELDGVSIYVSDNLSKRLTTLEGEIEGLQKPRKKEEPKGHIPL